MHFSKNIVAIFLLVNFFSLYNSAPENQLATMFSLSSTDSYYYEQKDRTSRIILENSQQGPLQGMIYKDRLFVWLSEATEVKISYYENQGVEVINKFFTDVEKNYTLMAWFIQENVLPAQKGENKIINTVNKTNYGLFAYKHPIYNLSNGEGYCFYLYTNYIDKEKSNKIQLKNIFFQAFEFTKYMNPVKSQIYPCKPNDPSADAIICIFSKETTKIDKNIEYDICDIGYYNVIKKEFTHRKSLDKEYFKDILYLQYDKNIKDLFTNLYQNHRPSTNTLAVSILNLDGDASVTISIDDCKCEWKNNDFLFSVLIRVFVFQEIPLPALHILLQYKETNKPFNFNGVWTQLYIQIPEGNTFYSGPLYFRDIDKKQSYTLLPIVFNENMKQSPCNLDIKIVDKKDYFKQSPEVNKRQEEEILKGVASSTQYTEKDISLMHTPLSDETKKLFDKIRTTLQKKDTNSVESIKIALFPIVEQLEKLFEIIATEAEMLQGIHNRFEVEQNNRSMIIQKEIDNIGLAAQKSQGTIQTVLSNFNNQLNTLKNEFKKHEEELGNLKTTTQKSFTKDFEEITLKLINDFQKMINTVTSTFTSQTKDLLEDLQKEYTTINKNFKEPLEKIKQDGEDTVSKLNEHISLFIVLQKKFEGTFSEWLGNIETIFTFVNELEKFKKKMILEVEKKQEAQIVTNNQLENNIINLNKEVQELKQKDTEKEVKIASLRKTIDEQKKIIDKSQGFNWRLNFCCLFILMYCGMKIYNGVQSGQFSYIHF